MATSKELLTNLADELRTFTNTSDKMGLSKMAEHVAEANDEVDSQDALVEQLISAMQGKSVPGGDASGGIQYEIITIPAGATSATYTLPRVTHAYGSREPVKMTYKSESNLQPIFSIRGTDVIYVDDIWGITVGGEDLVRMDILCGYVRYDSGTITLYDGYVDVPLTLLLVNDPSAPAISM